MYTAVIHEGELVESPTGRQWVVMGWEPGRERVKLRDPVNDEEVALHPKLLKHVSSAWAGLPLEAL